jgi:uncharacterized membrane-anchored protein YhcB (DUF1043 family)
MDFNDRKTIHIELALGMKSEENALQRSQIIKQTQTQLNAEVAQAVQAGVTSPDLFKKLRKPYEDTLYTLGVKNADTYLVTLDEVTTMAKDAADKAQKASEAAQQNPSPDDQKKVASAKLDIVRAQEITADMNGNDAKRQLEGVALLGQHKARAF